LIAADRIRSPSAVDLTAGLFKDWLHVNIFDFARGQVAVVNVSLHGDPHDPRSLAAAALLLGDLERGWAPHVEVLGVDEAEVGLDGVAVGEIASIALDPASGGLAVHARSPGGRMRLDLAAFAAAPPIIAERPTPFGSGWLAWRAIPRLNVTGWLSVDGVTRPGDATVMYHDHNWGRWHWGDDAGWEWAAFLAAEGDAFVTTRTTDRNHETGGTTLHGVAAGRSFAFEPRTVRMRLEGRQETAPKRAPGAMAALHSGRARPQLPSSVVLVADDGYDRVEIAASLAHAAQIVVAEPAQPGYAFIHELLGTFAHRSLIRGVETTGQGLVAFEYVD
jgi:hypothetical protein